MSGTVDITSMEKSRDPLVREQAARLLAVDAELRKRISPKGALGLDEHLDSRRLEYGIPDGAFAATPAFERVYVFQLPELTGETYGDTSIVVPDTYQDKARQETARGIIVGAGLTARDYLTSHGMLVGDVVHFIRMAPFQRPVASVRGKLVYVIVMNAGDITASEDTAERLRSGALSLREEFSGGTVAHRFTWNDGRYNCEKPAHVANPEDL